MLGKPPATIGYFFFNFFFYKYLKTNNVFFVIATGILQIHTLHREATSLWHFSDHSSTSPPQKASGAACEGYGNVSYKKDYTMKLKSSKD